ncbi:MAG TPA: hypothetical protein VFR78_16330 [Pyrinomonadaceae bacterium]|nr:hypothetical protein [Pyrinomonadaceae bacterium]
MVDSIRIYADFLKVDDEGRLILSCRGTMEDLANSGIELKDGLVLTFYSDDADDAGNPDDLIVQGVVRYNDSLKQWVAVIDWNAIKHVSDNEGHAK